MPRRLHPFLPAAAAVLLALPLAAQQPASGSAQQNAAQQNNTGQKKPEKKSTAGQKQSTAEQNPFPEAQSEKAAQQTQQQTQPQAQPQTPPAAPAPATPHGASAADQNPFPEAQSEKAAKAAQQQQNQDSSSSAVPGLKLPTTRSKQPTAPVFNPSLGHQDTKVGNFYLESGDWKGAYSRFLEATQVNPGDAEAVYGLAASARHMGYRKVAIQNFQLYLSALPNGPRAKDCRKALKEMGARP